jgi:hypothetical protein
VALFSPADNVSRIASEKPTCRYQSVSVSALVFIAHLDGDR